MNNKTNNSYIEITIFAIISTIIFSLVFYFFFNSSNDEKNNALLLSKEKIISVQKKKISDKDSLIQILETRIMHCKKQLKENKEELEIAYNKAFGINPNGNDISSINPTILKKELDFLLKSKQDLINELSNEISGKNGPAGWGPRAQNLNSRIIKLNNRIEIIRNKLK